MYNQIVMEMLLKYIHRQFQHIVLAHELIHLKHNSLNNPKEDIDENNSELENESE